jgi:hypothetical protein
MYLRCKKANAKKRGNNDIEDEDEEDLDPGNFTRLISIMGASTFVSQCIEVTTYVLVTMYRSLQHADTSFLNICIFLFLRISDEEEKPNFFHQQGGQHDHAVQEGQEGQAGEEGHQHGRV